MKLHAAGKVRHFGVSNYTPSQFDMLQTRLHQLTNGKLSLVTNQVEASVLELQCLYDGTFDQCQVSAEKFFCEIIVITIIRNTKCRP